MKFYFRKKRVHFEMYEYDIFFVETNDFVRARKKLNIDVPQDERTGVCALTFAAESGLSGYILIPKKAPINDIVHECWHITHHILTYRHVPLADEVVAYHLDYVVKKALDFYGKKC